MNKVVTINLNGNAYQLEEPGYDALRAYLDTATARLENNPDRAEIMSDLEQAISEKCHRHVGAHKNVVTAAEIDRIIIEMGPVNGDEDDAKPGRAGERRNEGSGQRAGAPRRLYQVREGAMISGVCNGLAAYFNIDVTLVRVAFVFLAIVTSGGWVLAYLLMMFVVPEAHSSEERAAAHGQPFNAQQLVDRAKQQYAEFRENSSQWQEKWRRRREARRERRAAMAMAQPPQQSQARETGNYATRVFAGFMVPVFTFLSAVLFVGLVIAMISLFKTGAIFHWSLPNDIPIWVAIIVLVLVYHAISTPLRTASRASYETSAGSRYGWLAAADGLMWLAFAALLSWLAYLLFPEVRWLIQSPFDWEHSFWGWFI